VDLAGQARVAGDAGGEVEHVLLFFARLRQAGEILGVDDDVAGGAGHLALARSLERLAVGLRDVEQALAGLRSTSLMRAPSAEMKRTRVMRRISFVRLRLGG
jgi:hypothetical protein